MESVASSSPGPLRPDGETRGSLPGALSFEAGCLTLEVGCRSSNARRRGANFAPRSPIAAPRAPIVAALSSIVAPLSSIGATPSAIAAQLSSMGAAPSASAARLDTGAAQSWSRSGRTGVLSLFPPTMNERLLARGRSVDAKTPPAGLGAHGGCVGSWFFMGTSLGDGPPSARPHARGERPLLLKGELTGKTVWILPELSTSYRFVAPRWANALR